MKMSHLIFPAVIIIGGIILYLISTNNKSNSANASLDIKNQDTVKLKETKLDKNFYADLRSQSLSVTPTQLKLNLESSITTVYGIVMDYDMGPAIATVVAFQSGDASLYLSAGQIFIGGHARDNIRNAGLAFVKEAQSYLSIAKQTESTTLPDTGCVKFYLLTNKGKYFHQEPVVSIKNASSIWTKLFYLGNDVITQYRMIDQKR